MNQTISEQLSRTTDLPPAAATGPEPPGTDPALTPDAPDRAPATVSVIIPVHNKASLTQQCLDTILAQSDPLVDLELIVVDDGSSDLTPELLRDYGVQITVITNRPGKGFAGACNAGAAASSGEYLIFLNNDTIPRPGWASALVTYSENRPGASIVGSKLLYPDGSIQHAGVAIGYDRFPRHIYTGFPSTHPAVNKSRQFQIVTAACLLIRRGLWDTLEGFDTAYHNGWEDVDLCLRARKLGEEVHYCHESEIYHLESVSRDVRSPQETANRELYVERWADEIVPDDFQFYLEDELIQITYQARYPLHLTVSPRLASWTTEASLRESDRMLAERARQVTILLRNNIVLNTRVHEAEMRAQAAEKRAREVTQRLRDAGLDAAAAPGAAAAAGAAAPANIVGSIEQPGRLTGPVSGPVLPISGWAVSPYGIALIETIVDGNLVAAMSCGLPRSDVAATHPGYPDSEDSGFAADLLLAGLSPGKHTVLLRIHDKLGRFADAAIDFELIGTGEPTVLLNCDQPAPGHHTNGRPALEVAGWALAAAGIDRIESSVDGETRGTIMPGGARPDVAAAHADRDGAAQSGFSGTVPLDGLPPGDHALRLRAIATDQSEASLDIPFTIGIGQSGDDTDG
jgi:GT2 family glycosyltransferase